MYENVYIYIYILGGCFNINNVEEYQLFVLTSVGESKSLEFFFNINFSAIMHRRTIVHNSKIRCVCSCFFFSG